MPHGAITDELVEFHAEVARGGTALTTVAYCSVSPEGRVHRDTIVLDRDSIPGLRRLTDASTPRAPSPRHRSDTPVSSPTRSPTASRHSHRPPASAPAMGLVRGATLAQLDQVVEDYEHAARNAVEAGFDALEVHLGHNYLLSSFMSPNLNKRSDRYGGTLEKRSAFPRRVLEAVRKAVGDKIAIIAKFNMTDGVPKGLWLNESLPIAKMIEADGHIDAMELTGGSSLLNGMYFFRGEVPLREFMASQPKVVGWGGLKFYGPKIFPTYPFEEGFFLQEARQFRAELKLPIILLGGINRLDTIEHALDEGFEFVAMGRALLRDPSVVDKFRSEQAQEGLCIHCNKCMPTIYTGTRCVIRETLRETPRTV